MTLYTPTSSNLEPIALYIHWPFCLAKCPYCDFNSHVMDHIPHATYLNAYLKELEYFSSTLKGRTIKSIFFGGGTPSLMEPSTVSGLLSSIKSQFDVNPACEITLEANPTSSEFKRFEAFEYAGVNRLSLGIQSLNKDALMFLGRKHSKEEALKAIEEAKSVFTNVSFDLIYARPEQTLSSWEDELSEALEYVDKHISLYQLTIEKGTPFYQHHAQGRFTLPSDDEAHALYEYTHTRLESLGLFRYEVSNYAQEGFESQHNLSYWRYTDYLGLGPGAHSRIRNAPYQHTALMMRHKPTQWLASIANDGHAVQQNQSLSQADVKRELLLMSLRTKEGLSAEQWESHIQENFCISFPQTSVQALIDEGLIDYSTNHIKATHKGIHVLNAVIQYLDNL